MKRIPFAMETSTAETEEIVLRTTIRFYSKTRRINLDPHRRRYPRPRCHYHLNGSILGPNPSDTAWDSWHSRSFRLLSLTPVISDESSLTSPILRFKVPFKPIDLAVYAVPDVDSMQCDPGLSRAMRNDRIGFSTFKADTILVLSSPTKPKVATLVRNMTAIPLHPSLERLLSYEMCFDMEQSRFSYRRSSLPSSYTFSATASFLTMTLASSLGGGVESKDIESRVFRIDIPAHLTCAILFPNNASHTFCGHFWDVSLRCSVSRRGPRSQQEHRTTPCSCNQDPRNDEDQCSERRPSTFQHPPHLFASQARSAIQHERGSILMLRVRSVILQSGLGSRSRIVEIMDGTHRSGSKMCSSYSDLASYPCSRFSVQKGSATNV
ncbi:uncharacterized protein ARMOST_11534 [Armillaria ostoyae]|uniref:Uncharacterized protein n=1 Tax=Armillaria ostoyae TaxID=47428 RepID=A0A284RHE6_ARMOS|nr:uncharacterized protein ARMOST_11534 [Armillaria ostoyae]